MVNIAWGWVKERNSRCPGETVPEVFLERRFVDRVCIFESLDIVLHCWS